MKYHLSSLALWLPSTLQKQVQLQAAGRDPQFTDVRWIGTNHPVRAYNPDFLYVGNPDSVSDLDFEKSDIWVLTVSPVLRSQGKLLVLPEPTLGIFDVYEALRQALYDLNQWIITLDTAVIEEKSLQTLLTLSQSILQNPIVIFDPSFHVLAVTDTFSKSDVPVYNVIQAGKADPETILRLQAVNRSPLTPLGNNFFYQQTDEISGIPELFIHIDSRSGALLARVNVHCRKQSLTSGFRHLLSFFLSRAALVLEKQQSGNPVRSLDDYFFQRLIDGASNIEEIASVLDIPVQGEFMIICLNVDGCDSTKIVNLASQIELMIPSSRPFLYEKQLLVFLGISSTNQSSLDFWNYQEQRLSDLTAALGLQIGVSNLFHSLNHLKLYCQQALAAMRAAAKVDFSRWSFHSGHGGSPDLCFYQHIAAYDMVDYLRTRYPLQGIGTPTYWPMRKHDLQRGNNNCRLLTLYLKNDCQAAPTAEIIHMHRNSIVYRINKMSEQYHLDLKDPQFKFLFLMSAIADEAATAFQSSESDTAPEAVNHTE